MTIREAPTAAYMRENWAALVEERNRLKAVIDMVAESVIVRVVVVAGQDQITWGCGVCNGEYRGHDLADGRGAYAHETWCPRKT